MIKESSQYMLVCNECHKVFSEDNKRELRLYAWWKDGEAMCDKAEEDGWKVSKLNGYAVCPGCIRRSEKEKREWWQKVKEALTWKK